MPCIPQEMRQIVHIDNLLEYNPVTTMIILCMGSANERRHYKAILFLISWAHTQNDLCNKYSRQMPMTHLI